MKIIPLSSEVKFDIIKSNSNLNLNFNPGKENNENSDKDKDPAKIFLYNPWERDDNINYYWTANSYQRVFIQFYNPLALELKINKIVLIFEGNKPFSFPSKIFNYILISIDYTTAKFNPRCNMQTST